MLLLYCLFFLLWWFLLSLLVLWADSAIVILISLLILFFFMVYTRFSVSFCFLQPSRCLMHMLNQNEHIIRENGVFCWAWCFLVLGLGFGESEVAEIIIGVEWKTCNPTAYNLFSVQCLSKTLVVPLHKALLF